MKFNYSIILLISVVVLLGCKKEENEPENTNVFYATFNGAKYDFEYFSSLTYHYDEEAYANVMHIRAIGGVENDVQNQISIRIKDWEEGVNENNPSGGIYKVWATLSIEETYYYAEHNSGHFTINLTKNPSNNQYNKGTFEGTLKNDSDSIVMSDGFFQF